MQPSPALNSCLRFKRHGLVQQLHTISNAQGNNAGGTYAQHCFFSTCEMVSGRRMGSGEAGAEASVPQEWQG